MKRRELLQSLAAFAGTAAAKQAWGGMIPKAAKTPASRDAFFWGAATAGHQVEGNCVNDDAWALEQLSPLYLQRTLPRQLRPISPVCAGHWDDGREWGLTAYRFSVEWSRIEPAKGEFSQAELGHYRPGAGVLSQIQPAAAGHLQSRRYSSVVCHGTVDGNRRKRRSCSHDTAGR